MKDSHERAEILLVYYSSPTFIENDYRILSKHFNVSRFQWRRKRDLLEMSRAMKRADLTFSWFANDHAAVAVYLAKRHRKLSVVVAGGGDVAHVPELGYGRLTQSWLKRAMTRYALQNADVVLPVSEFTKSEVLRVAKPNRMEVVYNGVDVEMFRPGEEKEDIVVTISQVTETNLRLKGLETFVAASRRLPSYQFVIIGETEEGSRRKLEAENPEITFTGQIPHAEVARWLGRAKVYCQPSYREAFGVGVAEAMASGCVPVVTDRGALPELVNDAGLYISYGDAKGLVDAIRKAVAAWHSYGTRARRRAEQHLSLAQREEHLLDVVSELFKR